MRRCILSAVLLLHVVGCGRFGYSRNAISDGGADLGVQDFGEPDLVQDLGADLGTLGSVLVSPSSGLVTSETGATATFTVVLTAQPAANVTIMLSSSDTSEGRVAPPVLAFTRLNWDAPQTVTVTGVDDPDADGPQTYTIVTAPTVSSDPNFNGINAQDVAVTNTDNETAGVTLSRLSGLSTTEGGGTDTFSVFLNAAPSADVLINLSSSDTAEATVSPSALTFTSSNWASAQSVTVTGVDDALVDGDQSFVIVTGDTVSTSSEYNGLVVDDVSGTNHDDETPAILVSPTSGLHTTEAGGTASFSVTLQAAPEASVLVPVASSNTAEGTVSSASLVFTTADWDEPQAVIVTGVNDAIADGDQLYNVTVGPSTSADAPYEGLRGTTVSITNSDDESASFTVTPMAGFVTSESGGSTSFTVELNTQPATNVVIDVASSDATEGTVAPTSITFTSLNWATPQTITLTGVDDAAVDGDQSYTATLNVNASSDAAYASLASKTVSVTNTDDESAGITVSPITGLTTSEVGGTATFSVVLNSSPAASVIINLSSDQVAEGLASPTALTFTPATWNVAQTVTVTGQDELIADGARIYHIITAPAVSGDPDYSGRNASDVTVTNIDNDAVGIVLTPLVLTTDESGAGSTATFSITLSSQPTAPVTFPLHMLNGAQGSVAPSSVVISPLSWAVSQTVTVSAIDDSIADGDFVNTVITDAVTSPDAMYNGMNPMDVSVTHRDNDMVGVIEGPATSGLVTTELGGNASAYLVLRSQPTADVTFSLTSTDLTEGTVSTSSITITPATWNVQHAFTVMGVSDGIADGNIAYQVLVGTSVSADPNYNGIVVPPFSLTSLDSAMPGIGVTPTSGLHTSEAGTTATFTVVLATPPLADVTIALSSTDMTEGTVSPASLTFTTGNWSVAQTVTVTGVDDAVADGLIAYTIVTGSAVSSDGAYSGRAAADVSVDNSDNEVRGFLTSLTFSPIRTWEGGSEATIAYELASQPAADVTIPFSVSDATEGAVSPSSLTFTQANWNVPQMVTLSGVDDTLRDGDQSYTLMTGPVSSPDAYYNGYNGADHAAQNLDDDSFIICSRTDGGTLANGNIWYNGALSYTGRYMALNTSGAYQLTSDDTNAFGDAYVFDRATLTNRLVSKSAAGVAGNGLSYMAAISDDASVVQFVSLATNLGPADANGQADVYLSNLLTNVVTRSTITSTGGEPNAGSTGMGVSNDGRYSLFVTQATNMTPADGDVLQDVYVRDSVAATTILVSVSTAGVKSNGNSATGTISGDGRYVMFESTASNLVVGDTNGMPDTFVRDLLLNTTTRVSVTSAGLQASMGGVGSDMSADARYVVFASYSSDLGPVDTNGVVDVYVRDRMLNTTTRVSFTDAGGEPNGASSDGTVSDDGQRFTYVSAASNIVAGDTNALADGFAYDRATGMTVRTTLGGAGQEPNSNMFYGNMSGDGRYVAYENQSTSLFPIGIFWVGAARLPF